MLCLTVLTDLKNSFNIVIVGNNTKLDISSARSLINESRLFPPDGSLILASFPVRAQCMGT